MSLLGKGKGAEEAPDPFTNTELPDIDVEDDLRKIADRNAEIVSVDHFQDELHATPSITWYSHLFQDKDLDAIGIGVTHLKNIANEMGEVRFCEGLCYTYRRPRLTRSKSGIGSAKRRIG